MRRTRLVATLLGAITTTLAASAHADAPGSDHVAAEALFDEGVRLMKTGDYAAACPKLRESQRLDAGVGTLVYLAECYARSGKTASAWATWREAHAAARAAGQADREKMAKARADALEAELPRVTVVVRAPARGTEVKRDDTLVSEGTWGAPVPVDPGEHTFSARAPGKRPWTNSIKIVAGQKLEVVVPALEDEAAAAPPPQTSTPPPSPVEPPPARSAWSAQRWAGVGVAGAGVVALGVGAFFAARASSTWSDVQARCPSNKCADSSGPSDVDSARTAGNVSTVLVIGGAALVAGGAVLWLTGAPKDKARTRGVRVLPAVDRSSALVTVGGAL